MLSVFLDISTPQCLYCDNIVSSVNDTKSCGSHVSYFLILS